MKEEESKKWICRKRHHNIMYIHLTTEKIIRYCLVLFYRIFPLIIPKSKRKYFFGSGGGGGGMKCDGGKKNFCVCCC